MQKKFTNHIRNWQLFCFSLLYILIIFAFAGIYSLFFPSAFYHSTINFEKSVLRSEKELILKGLKKAIIDNILRYYGYTSIDLGYCNLDVREISLRNLRIIEDGIIFSLSFGFETREGHKSPECPFFMDVELKDFYFPDKKKGHCLKTIQYNHHEYFNVYFISRGGFAIYKIFPHKLELNPSQKRILIDWLMKIYGFKESEVFDVKFLEIPMYLDDQLKQLKNGLAGFPSEINGNFWRMFYFSSVTITTLGYGDIVPLTNSARFFVAIETVLGIILIGVFLNLLANKIIEKRKEGT